MSRLTQVSLAHRTVIMLLALLAIAAGIFCTGSLKQELIPSMELPRGAVIAVYPGASPEVVEAEVAKPIESAISGISGITQVTSSSSSNYAQVSVQWDYEDNSDDMAAEISKAVSDITLPSTVTTRVITGSMDDIPVLIIAAASDADLDTFSAQMDDIVVPELKTVEGVRDVSVTGQVTKEVHVTLDHAKAVDKGIDQGTISQMYAASGTAIPAGTIYSADGSLDVQVGTTFNSITEISDMLLVTTEDPVRLGDISTVEIVDAETTSYSRVNGRTSLALSITKTLAGNTVATAHGVKDKLDELAATLGDGTQFSVIFDQSPFIEDSIRDLATEGGIGLVMAIIVIMVFLWSVKPTLITAISIPLSLLIALVGLYVGGDTLNILTLGALTVAIGRVVDDSIVIIENIKRHQQLGHIGRPATVAAVKEVAGAVTSSTLTTVAVFVPISLVSGQVGQMFRPFAVTVTIALLASLVVSMTVVPVLASWFMRVKGLNVNPDTQGDAPPEPAPETDALAHKTPLQRIYLPVLRWTLAHRALTLAIAAGLFAGSGLLATNLKTDFIGDMGQNMVQISIKLPAGTGLATADEASRQVEALLAEEADIESYQASVGGGSSLLTMMSGSASSSQVNIYITMKEGKQSKAMVERLRNATADMGLGRVQIGTTGATSASQAVVYVEAADPDKLLTASDMVQRALEQIPELSNVNSDLGEEQTMLRVDLKPELAADAGYLKATVGQSLAMAIRGQKLGTMADGESSLDVYLLSQPAVKSVAELGDVLLPATSVMTAKARMDALEEVSDESDELTEDAKQTATDAYNKQLKALNKAVSKAKKSQKDIKKQLSKINTSLEQAEHLDGEPVTKMVLNLTIAKLQLETALQQVDAGIAQTKSSITALKKQREATLEAQDKQTALTEKSKDAQTLTADSIKLSEIADVVEVAAPAKITRVDGVRAATVTGAVEGTVGTLNSQLQAALDALDLPDGVSVRIGGISQQQSDAFRQLGLAMIVAIGVIYLVMVATFGSLVQPLILIISIPFAATGVLGLSYLSDTPIGVPSLIGMLMLIGIVVTNAIVLIDLINQYRKRGADVDTAVTYGAALRVRPIVMTALATIFALLPMGLGVTGGSVFISKPLAIVVMGGLTTSTIATLILVPVIYDLIERRRERAALRREITVE
ncbi:MAG: efflux RND transporter permease subunit [Propionibacteriaceae bacterium]|jgi:HAE1 family hydrophobic/amphiphilic exporter-1|nr:efflux RND transporter permease subunit [Propionibacteriaceae bacterium]